MYTQQLKYLTLSIEEIKNRLEANEYVKDFAMIVHDKDVDENKEKIEDHLHVFVKLNQQKTVDYVAELFEDKANYVEIFNKSTKLKNEQNGYLYLLHKTKNAKNKHQYDIDALTVAENSDIKEKIEKWIGIYEDNLKKYQSKRRKTVVESILNDYANEIIDEKELKQSLTNLKLAKNKKLINDIKQVLVESAYQKYLEDERYKNKKIIWIYGESGSGKSLLSQKLAKEYTDISDIFVTSSNRDPFQEYVNQKVIIIEEFREETNIGINELLQLLDKTSAQFSAGSRYHNKKIIADLIIINTIHRPKFFVNVDEPFYQLARRIDTLLMLDNQTIATMQYNAEIEDFEVVEKHKNTIKNEELSNYAYNKR